MCAFPFRRERVLPRRYRYRNLKTKPATLLLSLAGSNSLDFGGRHPTPAPRLPVKPSILLLLLAVNNAEECPETVTVHRENLLKPLVVRDYANP
jgi:hypothetical protein